MADTSTTETSERARAYAALTAVDTLYDLMQVEARVSERIDAKIELKKRILELASQPFGEPVLYRYWQPAIKRWGYTEDGSVRGVEPLYAAPQPSVSQEAEKP